MNKKKIITISVSSVLAAGLVAAELAIPLTSYTDFRTQKDEVIEAVIARDAETLKSIKAELKDGVEFFANGLADPDADDITVKAKYGGKYAPANYVTLESNEFTVTAAPDFSTNGGKISVSYMGKTATIESDLIPLEITDVYLSENPYLVAYEEDQKFDPSGMVVEAKFNDGIAREVKDYVYPTNALEAGTRTVECSFDYEEQKYTFTVPVRVDKTLDDGKIVGLESRKDEYSVEAGHSLASAEIMGRYQSGNRRILSADLYLLNVDGNAQLGKSYSASALLKSDITVNSDLNVRVYAKQECETATGVGIKMTTAQIDEKSYNSETGEFTSTGDKVTVLEEHNNNFKMKYTSFDVDVNKGLMFEVDASDACYGDIVLRTTNGRWSGGAKGSRNVNEFNFTDTYSYIVNGKKIHIADTVVVPSVITKGEIDQADKDTEAYNSTRSVFHDVRVKHVQFKQGKNIIQLKLDLKNKNAANAWDEIGAERMDCFRVETYGDPQKNPHILGESVAATQPTCTQSGAAEHMVCAECDNMVNSDGDNIFAIPALGHDYGEYAVTETEHSISCKRCDYKIVGEHIFETAHNDIEHWEQCSCGAVKNKEAHSYELDIVCNTADYGQAYAVEDFTVNGGVCTCGDRTTNIDITELEIVENKAVDSLGGAVKVKCNGVEYTVNTKTKVEAENSAVCELKGGAGTGNNPKVQTATVKASELRNDGKVYFMQPEVSIDCVQGFKVKDANWKNSSGVKWSDKYGEKSITVKVNVKKAGKYKLGASMTNSNCQDKQNKFGEIKLGNYFVLLADGASESLIPDTTVLKGSERGETNDATWTWFFDVDLGEIELTEGEHSFKFMLEVKPGMWGNVWDDYGDLKIDYFTFEMVE